MKFAVGDKVVATDDPGRNGRHGIVIEAYCHEDDEYEYIHVRYDDGGRLSGARYACRYTLVEAAPLKAGDTVRWAGDPVAIVRGTVVKAWGHFVIVDLNGHKTRALGRKRFIRVEAAGGKGRHGPDFMIRAAEREQGIAALIDPHAQQVANPAPKPVAALIKEQQAKKPDEGVHWLLQELRKMSDEGKRDPGVCSYIKGNSKTQRTEGQWADVCHARLSNYGFDECALWVNHHCKLDEQGLKDAHRAFVDWQINRGPFKDCFLTKDLDIAFNYGVLLDNNFPINQLKGAAIMLRTGTEYPNMLRSWWTLRGRGFNESVAYLTACQVPEVKGGGLQAKNVDGCHHILQRGQGMQSVKERFTSPLTELWKGGQYKNGGGNGAINTTFLPGGNVDIVRFSIDVIKQSPRYGVIQDQGYGGPYLISVTKEGRDALAVAIDSFLNDKPIPKAVVAPKKLEEQDL